MNRSLRSGYSYDTFLSPFTWRYGSREMRRVWSEEHKRRLWRRIWVALAEAEYEAGLVSQAELDDLRAHQDEVDMARSLEIEAEIGHDLMAEIRAYAEQCTIGGGSLDVFTKREYLLTKRKQMTVATPGQRMAFVEREMERDRDLPLVDIAHHLYATYKAGQPVQWLLGRWTRDELMAVLEHLYRKSGDRVWRSLAELTRSALTPTTKPLL